MPGFAADDTQEVSSPDSSLNRSEDNSQAAALSANWQPGAGMSSPSYPAASGMQSDTSSSGSSSGKAGISSGGGGGQSGQTDQSKSSQMYSATGYDRSSGAYANGPKGDYKAPALPSVYNNNGQPVDIATPSENVQYAGKLSQVVNPDTGRPYYSGSVDQKGVQSGDFTAAVVNFQNHYNLTKDGLIGVAPNGETGPAIDQVWSDQVKPPMATARNRAVQSSPLQALAHPAFPSSLGAAKAAQTGAPESVGVLGPNGQKAADAEATRIATDAVKSTDVLSTTYPDNQGGAPGAPVGEDARLAGAVPSADPHAEAIDNIIKRYAPGAVAGPGRSATGAQTGQAPGLNTPGSAGAFDQAVAAAQAARAAPAAAPAQPAAAAPQADRAAAAPAAAPSQPATPFNVGAGVQPAASPLAATKANVSAPADAAPQAAQVRPTGDGNYGSAGVGIRGNMGLAATVNPNQPLPTPRPPAAVPPPIAGAPTATPDKVAALSAHAAGSQAGNPAAAMNRMTSAGTPAYADEAAGAALEAAKSMASGNAPAAAQAPAQTPAEASPAAGPLVNATGKPYEGPSSNAVPPGATPAVAFIAARGAGINTDHLNPTFANRLTAAVTAAEAATGQKAEFISVYRDKTQQTAAYNLYKASGFNSAYIAARPGMSKHQVGEAADMKAGPVRDWVEAHAQQYGLEAATAHDRSKGTWGQDLAHVQLASGVKTPYDNAAPAPATAANGGSGRSPAALAAGADNIDITATNGAAQGSTARPSAQPQSPLEVAAVADRTASRAPPASPVVAANGMFNDQTYSSPSYMETGVPPNVLQSAGDQARFQADYQQWQKQVPNGTQADFQRYRDAQQATAAAGPGAVTPQRSQDRASRADLMSAAALPVQGAAVVSPLQAAKPGAQPAAQPAPVTREEKVSQAIELLGLPSGKDQSGGGEQTASAASGEAEPGQTDFAKGGPTSSMGVTAPASGVTQGGMLNHQGGMKDRPDGAPPAPAAIASADSGAVTAEQIAPAVQAYVKTLTDPQQRNQFAVKASVMGEAAQAVLSAPPGQARVAESNKHLDQLTSLGLIDQKTRNEWYGQTSDSHWRQALALGQAVQQMMAA